MKTKKKLILFTMLLAFLGVKAQIAISGKVKEQSTNLELPGVNVILKGTNTGTVTDFEGNYSINANQGDILIFSYLGFITQEVTVLSNNMDVTMVESQNKLDEVVIIGYGSTTVKDATGSVEKVDSEQFNAGVIASPDQLIAGKTAGVSVIPGSGQPGQVGRIRIRGSSSLSASNNALIVIDDVPIDNGNNGGQNAISALSSINPNDIESFVVLKDASATAIYGSRASGGVILITTKSGSLDAPLKVQLSTMGSIGTITRQADVLNAAQYRQAVIGTPSEALILPVLGNSDTDWQDEISQSALGTDTNLTLSKGFGSTSIRGNLGYTTQEGVISGSKFERTSGALAIRQNLFNNSVKININARGSITQNNFINTGLLGAAAQFDPTQPVFSGSDLYGGYYEWLIPGTTDVNTIAPRNPVGLVNQLTNDSETERALGNIKIDYYVPFLKGLNANVNLGFDYNEIVGERITPPTSASAFNTQGSIADFGSIRRSTLIDFFLNYKTEIESIKSSIELTAGHTFQKFFRENYNNNTPVVGAVTENRFATQNALESYVTRFRYSYDSKYLFTFSYRSDGSSRFSGDNRWGDFIAAAFAWNISEENFLRDSGTISNLKLRFGYGQTGQQEINADFGYLPVYINGADNQSYQLGDTFYNTVSPQGYDENIRWEESETYNVGLDYGFLNGRISGSIEYYTRETKDVFNLIPVPSGTNLTNQLLTNIGNLENSGFEFSIASDIIQKENFNWNIGFNLTYLTDEITKLNVVDDPSFPGVPTGGINGGVGNNIQIHQVGSPQSSFYVFKQVYDANGRPIENEYEDLDGDGNVGNGDLGDLYVAEKPTADYLLGFSSSTNYKNWDLDFTLRASIGNYVYNNVASSTGNAFGLHSIQSNRNVHTSYLDTNFQTNANLFSDYYLEDASFLKMDNISLSYNFKDVLKNDKIGLSAQFTVQNVFTITGYDGVDPEINNGIDNNFFPRPRTLLLGLNMNF